MQYCESTFKTIRWKTRPVMIGNVGVGGSNPVRIQSMTTSNTRDVNATVDQIIRLADAGCEIARVTVQGIKEAEACEHIKNTLVHRGYNIPIVADIHFYPPAAMKVADFVDKIRVNPGNFVDKRASFKLIEYDDASYAKEIEKIEEKFTPLVQKCKTLKRAMRIGTNHGSLSDRIMNRYGDSPRGMVESALEFARICRKNDYHDIVFSMKSSNPQVMIQAYRLLVAEMIKLGWDYPLHLGVTEAGQAEDGRIKSAMGIGTLLLDGIGDTIRVSLTEDAWQEIDPCKRLVNFAKSHEGKGVEPFIEKHRNVAEIVRRPIILPKNLSLHRDGTVIVTVNNEEISAPLFYKNLGCDTQLGRPKLKVASADNIVVRQAHLDEKSLHSLKQLSDIGVGLLSTQNIELATPLLDLKSAVDAQQLQTKKDRFAINVAGANNLAKIVIIADDPVEKWEQLIELKPSLICLSPTINRLHYSRHFFEWMQQKGLQTPVILNFKYNCSKDDLVIHSAAECGALLCDGLGDGIWIEGPYPMEFIRNLSFNILQAARIRTSKTDFISCPSCGRTLFDLQDVTKRIRSRTDHLPGVKIAIMGCIVNGPGEMADADFGYVGSKPGMIDLYVGKECIEKDIDFAEADDRLVALIKFHGRWTEPESKDEV